MKKMIQHWYQLAVYAAGIIAVILALGEWDFTQKILLAGLLMIQLHFFEEFGFPGGFPWIGMKVELHLTDDDPQKWKLNQISALFGNEWFALFVYLLPLFLPNARFLTLAAVLFALAELVMHLVYFNIAMKVWYNPGLATTILGLAPVSIYYLIKVIPQGIYSLADLALALVWIVLNYWIAFRSPIYKRLGSKKDYSFTKEEVYRAKPYMSKS